MATTRMIHVQVEEQVRKQASDAPETMGLSISDAVRVFLARVATEQRIPFAFRVPNAETRATMHDRMSGYGASRKCLHPSPSKDAPNPTYRT
ncbi:type II toxin-antitoxin system RelB/DinJ family antitoxin [Candidatus Thiosymbion oneisti]|uniref:type II toxin-antitoxin system RelB/DinJ family antitoxin n=1 Tax=Candidatus Thiosymbion oneisti TaxID=589554 RepID=UPI001060366B|nr:type II toxin-antitoxin system RelB/DinJ family antitoxin [Candidatus Thiosymbion oneisti]